MLEKERKPNIDTKREEYPAKAAIEEEKEGLWKQWEVDVKIADAVVCGEWHGSRENWQLYRALLEKKIFGGFAYELFDMWQDPVRNFVSRKIPFPEDILDYWIGRNGREQHDDGKISKEFIQFLQWFSEHQKDIPIILFDTSSYAQEYSWNARDEGMRDNFLGERNKLKLSKPFLVGCGGLHARRKPFTMKGEKRYPFAYHLAKQMNVVSTDFEYLSGNYLNIENKKIVNPSYQEKSPNFLLGYKPSWYRILVKKSHPVRLCDERDFS